MAIEAGAVVAQELPGALDLARGRTQVANRQPQSEAAVELGVGQVGLAGGVYRIEEGFVEFVKILFDFLSFSAFGPAKSPRLGRRAEPGNKPR